MSDDLEFDFFAEETQPSVVSPPRAARLAGVTRRQRRTAIGVAASLIVLILVIVLATGGASSSAAAEKSYLQQLSPIATDSQQTGRALEHLFAGLRSGQVVSPQPAVLRLAARARADLARARRLRPPGGLRSVQAQVLSALDLRAGALQDLHAALASTSRTQVTVQIDRLVTSDVIWHDLVWRPAVSTLAQAGARPPVAPESQFLADLNDSAPQQISELLHPSSSAQATLTTGATGPETRAWQVALNRWLRKTGRQTIATDGSFGSGTQAATAALQRAEGLKPDGIVGPATRRALAKALASK